MSRPTIEDVSQSFEKLHPLEQMYVACMEILQGEYHDSLPNHPRLCKLCHTTGQTMKEMVNQQKRECAFGSVYIEKKIGNYFNNNASVELMIIIRNWHAAVVDCRQSNVVQGYKGFQWSPRRKVESSSLFVAGSSVTRKSNWPVFVWLRDSLVRVAVVHQSSMNLVCFDFAGIHHGFVEGNIL